MSDWVCFSVLVASKEEERGRFCHHADPSCQAISQP